MEGWDMGPLEVMADMWSRTSWNYSKIRYYLILFKQY